MSDYLVPFDRFVRTLPAGLPLRASRRSDTAEVSSGIVDLQDPCWTGCLVDLSAPQLDEHGEPARLDALPWATGVLLRRPISALLAFDLELNGALAACTERHSGGSHCGPPAPWWPDLTAERAAGDEDAAMRAVVCAALRAGVGLEQPGGSDV
jgi:hypothetical protein